MEKKIKGTLFKCLKSSIKDEEFHWDKFFEKWFKENGNPLFFLFKKNLGVTNLQYVELFSLINNNLKSEESNLLFHKGDHVRQTYTDLIESVLQSKGNKGDEYLNDFIELNYKVFQKTVTVDLFYNSCAIFLPPGVEIELSSIVFESGYIHSAGKSIYIRNIKKANKIVFKENIKKELEKSKEKTPFVIYSHEDFSDYDKESSDQIDKGIDQCKIYIDKMNMGTNKLSQVIDDLSIESPFKEFLISPQPGNYQEKHQFKNKESFWLIIDRSISGGSIKNPGQNRFYICYKQQYKNESHYYYFDENKPAWKSHTTLPHSLTSSLINSCKEKNTKAIICDPFGGTATTWLESKRINGNIFCETSDLSNLTNLLAEDNLTFFSLSSGDLDLLNNVITKSKEEIENLAESDYKLFKNDIKSKFELGFELISQLKIDFPDEENEFTFQDLHLDKLKSLDFTTRILFYIMLRSTLRYNNSFKRKAMKFQDAYKKSCEKLNNEIKKLIKLKIELESINHSTDERFYAIEGKYSLKLIPKCINEIDNLLKSIKIEVVSSRDARSIKNNYYDIIICDPPYGFNTEEDIKELSILYDEFLEKAIGSLKPFGQLVICLPAESYTGKGLPYCTRMDLISRQILIKSREMGKRIYKDALSLPLKEFEPPYYWESDKALRRGILHFRFF